MLYYSGFFYLSKHQTLDCSCRFCLSDLMTGPLIALLVTLCFMRVLCWWYKAACWDMLGSYSAEVSRPSRYPEAIQLCHNNNTPLQSLFLFIFCSSYNHCNRTHYIHNLLQHWILPLLKIIHHWCFSDSASTW